MSLIACPDCKQQISNQGHSCPQCGCPTPHSLKPSVVVSNVDMEFGTMVSFMVKAAIAAIPAAIILFILGAIMMAIMSGIMRR